ncbi:Ig-like domain-containing protein [Vulcanisaeta sp. JCM 16161]|uniref:Ig-like domain-containing protein n=1 Tax=Vulcanisaeta sp. JCM 16161 TaxID=1295372 RepID=UPI0006D186DF|nr:Ig-like domain-containing protein [Vulcanisaeta sp. JCM 16161]
MPALTEGSYNASLSLSTIGYAVNYYFTVSSVIPGVTINTTTTKLYSGVPQMITLDITNSTPIPISSALIAMIGTGVVISNGVITVKPPINESITVTPGPYSLGTATITFRISYTDAGGYTWNENETLTFAIVPTPVYLALSMQSTVNYGNYMPITINATTPVGPLQNQELSIYVDNNYVTTVATNSHGIAQYSLLVNYGVGYHVLTVVFTNTTYFQEATINYTFIVLPGTVYIIAYVNNTNVTYGSAVNIYVRLSPPISGGTLTIGYELNGLASTIGSYTPINGTVQITWIPPQAGTYLITIYYTNPPNYLPSSTNLTITVSKAPCSLSITINGTPEVLHELVIQSQMSPIIVNAQLNVLITSNTSSIGGTMYINASGIGTYTFIPKMPGNYSIIVSWPGNINYKGCRAIYTLNVMKAPLTLYVNGSSNLIAAGGYETFRIGIVTNIPINYVNGNLTIIIKNGNKTVSMYNIPITGSHMKASIPFPEPGFYEVSIQYPGNEYVDSSTYGPYYITVIPGVLGIPWYMLLAYLAPIILGVLIGMVINRRLHQA